MLVILDLIQNSICDEVHFGFMLDRHTDFNTITSTNLLVEELAKASGEMNRRSQKSEK